MVAGQYQLSQVASSDLMLTEKHMDLGTRVQQLHREVEALNRVASGTAHGKEGPMTYDVLRIAREYDRVVLDHQKALDDAEALKQSIGMLADTRGTYDRLIKSLQSSPYVLAAEKDTTVAFVPYENGARATPGTAIYACRVGFVVCRKVGTVARVLDGEVEGRHPLFSKELRGSMIVLHLDDPKAASQAVLHVGRAPLFL